MMVAYVQQVISGWPSRSATELKGLDIFIRYLWLNQNFGVILCEPISIAGIGLRSSPKME